MQHRRWLRVGPYQDTPRMRAALQRSQREAREKLPLLGALTGAWLESWIADAAE